MRTAAIGERCAVCGGEFSRTRTIIDGNRYHPGCAIMSHGSHTARDMAYAMNKLWSLFDAAKKFEETLSADCDSPEREALRKAIHDTYA